MEKRGLQEQLETQDTTRNDAWSFSDEMRFGLYGQVRRRWGKQGVKIHQPLQIVYEWWYLVLAIDVIHLDLRWDWSDGMSQADLLPIFERWDLDMVIWDGARSHHGQIMHDLPMTRIFLPAYSPELNPAERIFEEIRPAVEGIVYPSLVAKQYAIDQFLRRLRADKSRLQSLVSWDWIHDVFDALPPFDYTCFIYT